MRNQTNKFITGLLIILAITNCNSNSLKDANSTPATLKFQSNDPFKNSIAQSQYFEFDSRKDNIVEGGNGTIIVCPKGCFKDSKGGIVAGNVKVELAEALSLDEMILSNLTTNSNGNPLETGGMVYFNATLNGGQLSINKDNPVHFEVPARHKKQGMSAYKGVRDEAGNMNWINPCPIVENYLVPVDLNLLDFMPDGFQAAVEKGMPYRNYQTATKELTDSLYYSLSVSNGNELSKGFVNSKLNEPYYNKNKKIFNGIYADKSYQISVDSLPIGQDSFTGPKTDCGIDPAIIKLIKSAKYQNTLISTREFETRLKVIFKTCNNSVLAIYTKNTDRNLYKLDSLAELALKGSPFSSTFHSFYLQKLTRVEGSDKYAALLKDYYESQLTIIKSGLQKAKADLVLQLNKKNREAEGVVSGYRKLLWGREKYRMETYGFNWTETGWVNVDTGTIPKTWGPQKLEITIQNVSQFDRIYTYVVYTSIRSLYRLNTDNNQVFYVGNNEDKKMLMPKHQMAYGIAVAYKGEALYLGIKQFETGTDTQFTISPESSTMDKIKETIRAYNWYEKENQISVDLLFMDKFFIEQNRQKALLKETEYIYRLWHIAYPCCSGMDSINTNFEK